MSYDILTEAFSVASGVEFEEVPVSVETFVTDPQYMDLPPLSDIQTETIRKSTQIYRRETLDMLYSPEFADERWGDTKQEVIAFYGKGAGKDFMSTITVCYVVYLLLCLKDPQKYFGKPKGDNIDIMNIAINAQQASRVFFKGVKDRLKSSPWFQGKYEVKRDEINFDKSINLISGHSEAESLEGYNVILVVLDEIAGFAMENKSGNKKAKTAEAIYNMHRASVTSRFPDEGKLVLLSFSRYDGDFMTKRYNEAIAEKEVIKRSQVLKLDVDLPDGMHGNEITVEWDEDHILRYKEPGTFALRRPSWYVNPTKRIENYTRDFFKDMGEALTRFACMPTASKEDAFFPAKEKLDSAFVLDNAMDENGVFLSTFTPQPGTKYFVHVDLAQKHDRCAVSMAHVDAWTDKSIHGLNYHETLPTVVIDSVKFWQPTPGDSIDFQQVIDHILALRRRGFDIQLVTFDNWNSHDTRNNLEALGITTDKLSIKVDQYNEFKVMIYDDRCFGPSHEELVKELKELRWINGKVDHPRSGYNDLSDSVAGAVYNAIAHTTKPIAREVEVHTGLDIARKYRAEEAKKKAHAHGTIVAPTRRQMPHELQDYLNSKVG